MLKLSAPLRWALNFDFVFKIIPGWFEINMILKDSSRIRPLFIHPVKSKKTKTYNYSLKSVLVFVTTTKLSVINFQKPSILGPKRNCNYIQSQATFPTFSPQGQLLVSSVTTGARRHYRRLWSVSDGIHQLYWTSWV